MTTIHRLDASEVARLNEYYVKEAKKLRAKETARIFGGLSSRIFNAVAGIFSKPHTLAGSAR